MDYNNCYSAWLDVNLTKAKEIEIKNTVKDHLINSGKYDIWKNIQYAEYSKKISEMYGTEPFKKYDMYLSADLQLNSLEERCCRQIYESTRKRVQRFKEKLEYNINNFDCVFLTLTFRDNVLYNTEPQTRRDYIRKFLKGLSDDKSLWFGANIDYGDRDKNPESKEREHYHAVVNLKSIDLSSYPYGFIFAEKIRKGSNTACLSKYINKLTCHAYKDSTKGRDSIIYSR